MTSFVSGSQTERKPPKTRHDGADISTQTCYIVIPQYPNYCCSKMISNDFVCILQSEPTPYSRKQFTYPKECNQQVKWTTNTHMTNQLQRQSQVIKTIIYIQTNDIINSKLFTSVSNGMKVGWKDELYQPVEFNRVNSKWNMNIIWI